MKVEYKIIKMWVQTKPWKVVFYTRKLMQTNIDSGKAVERSVVKGNLVQKPRSSHGDNPRTREYTKQGRHGKAPQSFNQVVVRLHKFDAQNRSGFIYELTNEL